MAFCT